MHDALFIAIIAAAAARHCRAPPPAAILASISFNKLPQASLHLRLRAEEKITYIIERSLTAFASRHVGCLSFLYVEYYGTNT